MISSTFPRLRRVLVVLVLVMAPAWDALSGQEAERAAADPADVGSVDSIIEAVYDVISGPAGAERDWDRMRSLFLSDARLIPSFPGPDGAFTYRAMSLEDWIQGSTDYFAANAFFELEIHRVDQRYGHIAHAFSTYESRTEADGEPFARGINSFQLLNDGQRWWVMNIFWQSETEAEQIPGEYLP